MQNHVHREDAPLPPKERNRLVGERSSVTVSSGMALLEHRSRVRRPTDLLLAVLALTVIGLLFGIAHGLPIGTRELTDNVASWLIRHIPRALAFLFVCAVGVGCLVMVVVAAVVLLRSEVRE